MSVALTDASAKSAEEWADARNRWDTTSNRLSIPLEGTQTWKEATEEMVLTYKSEQINGYGNGFIGRAQAKYARMKDGDRHIRRNTDEYNVVLLTLGGRFLDENNNPTNPLTFREELLESRPVVRQKMKELMEKFDGLGFFSVVSGNGPSAYSHLHYVAFFREKITISDFNCIREAHVNNSPVARDIIPDNYVSIEHSSDLEYDARESGDIARGATCGATTYVASQAPHIGGLNQDDNQIEHSAVCRASNRWDTYISPEYAEHAEAERMERELAKVQRREKMRVRCGVEGSEQSDSNYLLVQKISSHPFLSEPTYFCLNQTQFGSNSRYIPTNPTVRYLFWLKGYKIRPEIYLTMGEN